MAKIGVDYGHGRNTFPPSKGVYMNGRSYHEHDFNAKLGLKLKALLEANGHEVVEAQKAYGNDRDLNDRIRYYNAMGVDLVVSVHANANGDNGADGRCAFYWYSSGDSKRAAAHVVDEIRKAGYSTHGNGLHASKRNSWTNLAICRDTKMPAVLVEFGFMTNNAPGVNDDFELIFGSKQDEYTSDMAEATFKGIQRYLGKSTEVNKPAPTKPAPSKPSKPAPSKSTYTGGSIVEYLNSIGVSSSYTNRKDLARKYGISGYKGTAAQNTELLAKMRGGASKKGANIAEDGYWGNATSKALQDALGTPVDGVISGQYNTSTTRALTGKVTYGKYGSTVIKALQRKVGVKADGLLGPGTVRALQRHLGTPVDGVISRPSLMVEELQRRLNEGTF